MPNKTPEQVCREWLANPLMNPRTGRRIQKDGPTYKALQDECKRNTAKPLTVRPSPDGKYTYEKLVDFYVKNSISVTPEKPLALWQIVARFDPKQISLHQLPAAQMLYKDISLFVNRVFLELKLRRKLESQAEMLNILSSLRHILDHRSSKTYEFITIIGAGCSKSISRTFEQWIHRHIEDNDLKINSNVVECNESLMGILKVIAKTYCFMKPSVSDSFVKPLVANVEKMLNQNKNVVILGYSYGGSIAATIARALNHHRNAHLLQVATFGSIYVAPAKEVSRVHIKQYMALGDVALKCANLTPPKAFVQSDMLHYDDGAVTWIRPLPRMTDKWDIHNNAYEDIADKIVLTQDVVVF
jgi:hypothetical protein